MLDGYISSGSSSIWRYKGLYIPVRISKVGRSSPPPTYGVPGTKVQVQLAGNPRYQAHTPYRRATWRRRVCARLLHNAVSLSHVRARSSNLFRGTLVLCCLPNLRGSCLLVRVLRLQTKFKFELLYVPGNRVPGTSFYLRFVEIKNLDTFSPRYRRRLRSRSGSRPCHGRGRGAPR